METSIPFQELELRIGWTTVALLNGVAHVRQDGECFIITGLELDGYNRGEESVPLAANADDILVRELYQRVTKALYENDDIESQWSAQLRDHRDESRYGYAEAS